MKVGVLIIATNNYIDFIPDLINSINRYFLKGHEVTIYLFTNKKDYINRENIKIIKIEHEKFPLVSLKRYEIFSKYFTFCDEDYLYYIDADMRMVDYINESILGDLVGVLHPGYINTKGTPERNKNSTAYIKEKENNMYFMGAFNGGKTSNYLKMCNEIAINVRKDLEKNFIAVWYDESHLNKYFLLNPPEIILTPSYCYPIEYNLKYKPKIITLSKDHKKYQV